MTKKKPEIIFAPGCFDNFDGTQKELQELIAEIHRQVEAGTLFENSRPLFDDEAEELAQMLDKKEPRQ